MPLSPEAQRKRREKLKKLGINYRNMSRELKKYPRRRCKNCDAPFLKTRKNKLYCKKQCADEYNKFGSAYGPLKRKIEAMIERKATELATQRLGEFLTGPYFALMLVAAGFDKQSEGSPELLAETWQEFIRPKKRRR